MDSRHKDSAPDQDAMFLADLVAPDGTTWMWWKGSLYRNGKGSALPKSMITDAQPSEYGEWI